MSRIVWEIGHESRVSVERIFMIPARFVMFVPANLI